MKLSARPMIWAIGALILSTAGVEACVVAVMRSFGSLPHPLCKIPAATNDEQVVVLSATRSSQRTNLHSLEFHRKSKGFEIVDVIIAQGAKPLYIVTYSYNPVIWRFQGALDSIARIISLGSEAESYKAVGYIGAPRDKIRFVEPLPDSHVVTAGATADIPHADTSVCSNNYGGACRPDDYVFRLSDADNAAVVKSTPKGKRTPGLAHFPDGSVLRNPPSGSALPAGVLPASALETPEFVDLRRNPSGASASLHIPSGGAPVTLDPAEVFSPMTLEIVNRGDIKAQ